MIKIETIFVNFTNHPSQAWDGKQREAAERYGTITDVPFPGVDASGDEAYIAGLAEECLDKILQLHPAAVLCQGEFTLAYRVITGLKEKGIPVLAACSTRNVKTEGNRKETIFVFERFREY